MAAVVGRVRECPLLDVKLTLLSHNLLRGAAGRGPAQRRTPRSRGFFTRSRVQADTQDVRRLCLPSAEHLQHIFECAARMSSYKSVSTQMTLTAFRTSSYEKGRGLQAGVSLHLTIDFAPSA